MYFVGLFLVFLIGAIFGGISEPGAWDINPPVYERSVEMCKNNDGLREAKWNRSTIGQPFPYKKVNITAICNDGSRVEKNFNE